MIENIKMKFTAACLTCRVKHESEPNPQDMIQEMNEFKYKHLKPSCEIEYYSQERIIPKGFVGSKEEKAISKMDSAPWWLEHPEFKDNANIKMAYAASVAFTYTSLNSLASDTNLLAGACSLSADNTTNLYLDFEISGFCKNNTGAAPTANKEIDVYLYNAYDDTPTFPDTILGTDATKTITTSNILVSGLAPFASTLVAATTSQVNAFRGKSVSTVFGGICPNIFGLFIVHNSGQAFASSGNTWTYKPVYMTSI